MFANVDYVLDFTNFSEYDEYVAEEANFASRYREEVRKALNEGDVTKAQEILDSVGQSYKLNAIFQPGMTDAQIVNRARAKGQHQDEGKFIKEAVKANKKEFKKLSKETLNRKPGESQEAFDARVKRMKELGVVGGSKSVTPATKSGLSLIPKTTAGKIAAGSTAGALVAGATTLGVMGARGVGPFATDNAKIARANRLAAKGHLDKANKVLGSVKDKTKLLGAPQAYAASELDY